jgi:hypothetical protein
MLAEKCSIFFPRLRILKNENAKFKIALRKYLNTHSFYPADEVFMYKDDV